MPAPIALQTHYSLVERSAEYEHVPAARELGIGVQPWSPLAGGFLSGKYRQVDGKPQGDGRLAGDNPMGQAPFTERNWGILEVVERIAAELNRTPAEIALAWTIAQSSIDTVLIGASGSEQIARNIAALEVQLAGNHVAMLDEASRPAASFPWSAFIPNIKRSIFGGVNVTAWRPSVV
jgi:aryl-alcohol dehydrogenase-like predicted oxidoreductase